MDTLTLYFHSNGTEQNAKAQMHILHGYWILTQIRIIELVRTRELLLNPILAYWFEMKPFVS